MYWPPSPPNKSGPADPKTKSSNTELDVLKKFLSGGQSVPFTKEKILPFLKKGKKAHYKKFSIHFGFVRKTAWGKDIALGCEGLDKIWFDAHYNLVLSYKGIAIAVLGIEIVDDEILFVKQLQGVKGRGKELAGFRWERFLLSVFKDMFFEKGFTELRVRIAKGGWHNETRDAMFKMRYETSALRTGFKYSINRDYTFIRREPSKK